LLTLDFAYNDLGLIQNLQFSDLVMAKVEKSKYHSSRHNSFQNFNKSRAVAVGTDRAGRLIRQAD
jgi:hypothetical protein